MTSTSALEEVRRLADCANVSQLARDSRVSRSQLNRIINKECDPNLETAEMILDALGYELVVQRKETSNGMDKREKEE